jgi:predicted lipid-binding transport protein (Tim44 family)
MPTVSRLAHLAFIFVFALGASFATFDDAQARRAGGGGFGSRGTRTYSAPPTTSTAPTTAAPIQRSMTPQPQTTPQVAPQPGINTPRPGFFSGFGRSMIGGLLVGGLFGMLLGQGFGGGFGFLGMLLQIALVIGALMLAFRFFANRQQSSAAAASPRSSFGGPPPANTSFHIPTIGASAAPAQPRSSAPDEIGLRQTDLNRFEQLLTEIQTAYGKEDYGTIRALTTPEAMSYLAEELGENATKGVRNSVSNVHLLQGDVAEAWHEDDADYATLAMRYSSVDAMLDRTTGRLVDGDDRNPSEATELWTFVRKPGSDWKLSAIQGTEVARH